MDLQCLMLLRTTTYCYFFSNAYLELGFFNETLVRYMRKMVFNIVKTASFLNEIKTIILILKSQF